MAPDTSDADNRAMDERVVSWSRGRRIRMLVADVPGDYDRLLRQVTEQARRTDDRERLADAVSAIFNEVVRVERAEVDGVEEVVLRVG